MKLCIINNSQAHYRAPIYKLIDQTWECKFFLGEMPQIKGLDLNELKNAISIKNKTFIKRPLYYLSGTVRLLFDKEIDTFLMAGEAYCLSTWLMLILRPIISPRKKIYLWSHGWYGREGWFKRTVLRLRTFLTTGIFTYGEYARNKGIEQGNSSAKIWTIHNSLDHREQLRQRVFLERTTEKIDIFGNEFPILIFIGRLTSVKKLDMALIALAKLKCEGHNYNLLFVGDGPERPSLEALVKSLALQDRVHFYGACYDETQIARMVYNSDLCVSPGNVGLTAMHSLVFGTPVITHNDFTHQMPEFEAIHPGRNGNFFQQGDVESLARTIRDWFASPTYSRDQIRHYCYEEIDLRWTPEFQISVLKAHLR